MMMVMEDGDDNDDCSDNEDDYDIDEQRNKELIRSFSFQKVVYSAGLYLDWAEDYKC